MANAVQKVNGIVVCGGNGLITLAHRRLDLVNTFLAQDLADRHAQFVRHDDQVFLVLALMQRHLLVQAYDLQLLR